MPKIDEIVAGDRGESINLKILPPNPLLMNIDDATPGTVLIPQAELDPLEVANDETTPGLQLSTKRSELTGKRSRDQQVSDFAIQEDVMSS